MMMSGSQQKSKGTSPISSSLLMALGAVTVVSITLTALLRNIWPLMVALILWILLVLLTCRGIPLSDHLSTSSISPPLSSKNLPPHVPLVSSSSSHSFIPSTSLSSSRDNLSGSGRQSPPSFVSSSTNPPPSTLVSTTRFVPPPFPLSKLSSRSRDEDSETEYLQDLSDRVHSIHSPSSYSSNLSSRLRCL